VTQGERSITEGRMQAQQMDSLLGKIVRINATARFPKDNPFVGKEGVRPERVARADGGDAHAGALHRPDWIFERKFDGIRCSRSSAARRRLYSRNRLPQNCRRSPRAIAALPVRDVILDGEVTWDGHSALPRVRHPVARRPRRDALPLEERRALLRAAASSRRCSASSALDDPRAVGARVPRGWEGVIAKRRGSPYEHAARSTG
jgi:ATP-dependent DNA ligase